MRQCDVYIDIHFCVVFFCCRFVVCQDEISASFSPQGTPICELCQKAHNVSVIMLSVAEHNPHYAFFGSYRSKK